MRFGFACLNIYYMKLKKNLVIKENHVCSLLIGGYCFCVDILSDIYKTRLLC